MLKVEYQNFSNAIDRLHERDAKYPGFFQGAFGLGRTWLSITFKPDKTKRLLGEGYRALIRLLNARRWEVPWDVLKEKFDGAVTPWSVQRNSDGNKNYQLAFDTRGFSIIGSVKRSGLLQIFYRILTKIKMTGTVGIRMS